MNEKWIKFTDIEKEKIKKWVDWYKAESKHEILEDQDFRSLAIGFFVALGSSVDDANSLYEKCIKLGFY